MTPYPPSVEKTVPQAPVGVADFDDLAALGESEILRDLGPADLGAVLHHLERTNAPAGSVLALEGEPDDALVFILDGHARVERRGGALPPLARGGHFGELVLAGHSSHPATVIATSAVRLARLSRAAVDDLSQTAPRAACALLGGLLRLIAIPAGAAPIPTGDVPTLRRAIDILPRTKDGARIVGALLDHRPISLGASVPPGSAIEPITTGTWIGREIFRRSAALVALEAARRLGLTDLRLGPSITTGRIVLLDRTDPSAHVAALNDAVRGIIRDDVPFLEETWDLDAAIALFQEHGWDDSALLLGSRREPTVVLVRCGAVRAIGTGITLPTTGLLEGVSVTAYPDAMLLDFGGAIRTSLPKRPFSTQVLEQRAPRYGSAMTIAEKQWLDVLGVTSVGSFNQACIGGRVREIVYVSEAFHEKHIAQTADDMKARGDVRVVAVAGPSSSGKSTFIKRLKLQLEVDGIHPVELSLDDYYRDRERAPRDAAGEPDFEALDALNIELFDDHLRRLLAGERLRTARFDFLSGRSAPSGGPEIGLQSRDVVLVEGIHGLNPNLFSTDAGVFRIFVNVATSLPFDRVSWLEPADLRLVRRIVRDRHQRGSTAADSLLRWPSVRRGERLHIYPYQGNADRVFDSGLVYEASVLKVFAERYLLEVPRQHPEFAAALRLRQLLDPIVPIQSDHVPPTSILREFIGQSGFSY